jgi:leader peptidase (prepilin peptidase)/N-methyltransferase
MIETIISMLPVAYVAATAIPLLIVDIKEHRLPNKIVLPMIGIALLTHLVLAVWTGAWASLGVSVGLGFATLMLGIYLNYKEHIGMGDVKLMTGLTMITAWFSPLIALMFLPLLVVIGAVVVIFAISISPVYRRVPMGPTILLAFTILMPLALQVR